MSIPKTPRQTKRLNPVGSSELVSRRREEQALEALVALALHQDYGPLTEAEIENYLKQPPKLSKEDKAALRRAHPQFLKALRETFRTEAKQLVCGETKPANDQAQRPGHRDAGQT